VFDRLSPYDYPLDDKFPIRISLNVRLALPYEAEAARGNEGWEKTACKKQKN